MPSNFIISIIVWIALWKLRSHDDIISDNFTTRKPLIRR
jgi:hypothetical protein